MVEKHIVLDEAPKPHIDANEELCHVTQRAERAEAELARLTHPDEETNQVRATSDAARSMSDGESELRKDSMMAHLLDSLEEGRDIGHYGRLVFAMVARHFMPHEEVLARLLQDPDFSEAEATAMLRQVAASDYNPPKRERILEWQSEQEFPILPKPDDPDCGNLYRNLKFPDSIYSNIEHYQEQKASAKIVDAQ
jgi:hypothetical protein